MNDSVCLMMFLWILTVSRGDTEVSCVVMETCILPCSFQVGSYVNIHWSKTAQNVHSYCNNQDQLGDQGKIYRDRTSLFKDQMSKLNASLQLTGVKVQDEGRYQCLLNINNERKESFINLKVDSPIQAVDFYMVGNRITCSSEGIYPEPELTWSTTPPSNINLHNTTTVQQNEQQLYSISSSLILSDDDTDLFYSCTVKTRRNKRTTTLRHQTMNFSEATIPCMTSNSDLSGFSLVWRFNLDQTILNQNRADIPPTITTEWKKYVKNVSESGDITLQDLSSGIYTCQLSNDEETYVTSTILGIEDYDSLRSIPPDRATAARMVVFILFLASLVVLVGFYIYKKKKDQKNEMTFSPAGIRLLNNGGRQGDKQDSTAQDSTAQVPAAQDSTAKDSTAQDSTAQDPTAQGSTAQGSTAQGSTAQDSTAQGSTAKDSTAQDSTAQDSTAQDSTAQVSTAQDSTAQDPAAQDSTAQDSTAQVSTAQDPAAQGSAAQDSAAENHHHKTTF